MVGFAGEMPVFSPGRWQGSITLIQVFIYFFQGFRQVFPGKADPEMVGFHVIYLRWQEHHPFFLQQVAAEIVGIEWFMKPGEGYRAGFGREPSENGGMPVKE